MRTLYLVSVIFIGLANSSCTMMDQCSNNSSKPVCTNHPLKKNPLKVTFYTKSQPKIPYIIIGEESISKFNLGGNKRQEVNIRAGMRDLAAAMGGDAIIDIKHDEKIITGTVVAFQHENQKLS